MMPAAMIAVTVSDASSMDRNEARMVFTASATWRSLTVTAVTRPNVPSVRTVDVQHPRQPVQTDAHAAERGCGAADEARARAARDDGHTLTVAEVHDRHDLGRALRQGDGVGGALVEGVHVALVDEPALRRHDEAVGAEKAPELIEDTGSKRHRTTYGGPVRR